MNDPQYELKLESELSRLRIELAAREARRERLDLTLDFRGSEIELRIRAIQRELARELST